MRRTLTGAAAMVVALALCGATDGASAYEKSGSTLVITKAHVIPTGNPYFPEATEVKGKVKSGKEKCRKNRKVWVYFDLAPRGPGPEDILFGGDKSNQNGRWTVTEAFTPNRVYAVLTSNRKCKGDTSKIKVVN